MVLETGDSKMKRVASSKGLVARVSHGTWVKSIKKQEGPELNCDGTHKLVLPPIITVAIRSQHEL